MNPEFTIDGMEYTAETYYRTVHHIPTLAVRCRLKDAEMYEADIPKERKDSILIWLERNKMSRVRQHILFGEKLKGVKLLSSVSFKKSDKKKYLETIICLFIPSRMIRKYVDRRDVGYYN